MLRLAPVSLCLEFNNYFRHIVPLYLDAIQILIIVFTLVFFFYLLQDQRSEVFQPPSLTSFSRLRPDSSEWTQPHLTRANMGRLSARTETQEICIDSSPSSQPMLHLHSLPRSFNSKSVKFATAEPVSVLKYHRSDLTKATKDNQRPTEMGLQSSRSHSVSYDHLPTVTGSIDDITNTPPPSTNDSNDLLKLHRTNSVPKQTVELQCTQCSALPNNRLPDYPLTIPSPLLVCNSCTNARLQPNCSCLFEIQSSSTSHSISCDSCRPPRKPPRPPDDDKKDSSAAWANPAPGNMARREFLIKHKGNSEDFCAPSRPLPARTCGDATAASISSAFPKLGENLGSTGTEVTSLPTKDSLNKLSSHSSQGVGNPNNITSGTSSSQLGSRENRVDLNIIPPPLEFKRNDQ